MSTRDPVIQALFDMLPPAGSSWPREDRQRWLEAARAILTLLYPERDEPLQMRGQTRAARSL